MTDDELESIEAFVGDELTIKIAHLRPRMRRLLDHTDALVAEVKRLRDELEEERWLRREDWMGSGEGDGMDKLGRVVS